MMTVSKHLKYYAIFVGQLYLDTTTSCYELEGLSGFIAPLSLISRYPPHKLAKELINVMASGHFESILFKE